VSAQQSRANHRVEGFFHVLPGSDAHLSHVGVGILRVDPSVVDDVLESSGHETSAAALVPVHRGAVDEVLGAEGHQLPRLQLHLGFEGSHGAERPARPTGPLQRPRRRWDAAPRGQGVGRAERAAHLVLHLRDAPLLPPVHGVRDAAARLPAGRGGPVWPMGNVQPGQQSRHLLAGLVGKENPGS